MWSRILAAVALVTAASTPAHANMVERFQEGVHYAVVDTPQPTNVPAGKVEVMEVFSYACPACAMFQPTINKWRATMPANVVFTPLAAAWNPNWEMVARAYYASEAMGIKDRTHEAFFKAIHVDRIPLGSLDDIAKWYATTGGVKQADFLQAMKSTGVNAKIARAKQLVPRLGVAATPTMVVAGKYRVLNDKVTSPDQIFEIVNFLVAREAAAAPATAR